MRRAAVIVLGLLAAAPAAAQEGSDAGTDSGEASARTATVSVGVGNAVGWLGGQAEWYFLGDRMSAFGGLGHTVRWEVGDPGGFTVAFGVRGYTAGSKHHGYLEASVSQIDTGFGEVLYGPGLQVGYQYAAGSGFTAAASAGVGYGLGANETTLRDQSRVQPMLGLTFGYTWR